MYYRPGHNSNAIAAQQYIDEQLKKKSQKPESTTLKKLGKDSALQETFEGITLENQDFSYINISGDITSNPDFIAGRTFGFALVENGFTEEQYRAYINVSTTKKHR